MLTLNVHVAAHDAHREESEAELSACLFEAEQNSLARLGATKVEGLVIAAHRDVVAGGGFKRRRGTGHGRHSNIQTSASHSPHAV